MWGERGDRVAARVRFLAGAGAASRQPYLVKNEVSVEMYVAI